MRLGHGFRPLEIVKLTLIVTGGNGIQVETENKSFNVICSRPPQTPEFGHYTFLFGRGQRRNIPQFKMHVQGLCFSN